MEKFALDENCTVELDLSAVSDLISAFKSTKVSQSQTLTCKNVGEVEGLDLQCTYGRSSSSVGINGRRSLDKNFDFMVSGELSKESFTASLMITEKTTGVSFGIEHKLTFDASKKNEFRVVIKVPVCGIEFVLKFDGATVARVVSAIIRSIKGGGSSLGSGGGSNQVFMVADFPEDIIYEEDGSIKERHGKKKVLIPVKEVDIQKLVQEIPVADNVVYRPPIAVPQPIIHTCQPRRETNTGGSILKVIGVAAGTAAAGALFVGGIAACFAFPWAAPVLLPPATAVVRHMNMHMHMQ